jgi:2-keto-4-pentenoate hydratase/2-oxohepta-3-ene-1,7-dioic acid hydratase in catechol pathway
VLAVGAVPDLAAGTASRRLLFFRGRASGGTFSPEPQAVYQRWDEFARWAAAAPAGDAQPLDPGVTGPPVPKPGQVFGIGLNYRDHASEAGLELPDSPMVFTKFPASVTGPAGTIALPPGSVDFEAELVAVIGRPAYRVTEADAWAHVAGLTAGQDLSERELQLKPPAPQQYNLGKSYPGFAPIGPVLVTPDEFANPDDLEVVCTLSRS